MGRPAVVSTEQILEAARELFLEQGFGVTTAVIARRAGVSEGSIFKRFASKEELFFAALGIPDPPWTAGLEEGAGQGEITENLRLLLLSLIEFFRELLPRVTVLWSCRGLAKGPSFWQDWPDSPPMRGLKQLTQYLDREMALSRIRPCNAEVLARVLLGSAQNFIFLEMMGIHLEKPMAAPDYVRDFIDILFRGLLPIPPLTE